MSGLVKKILLDYDEYARLMLIQDRYNELVKKKDLKGSGQDSQRDPLSKIVEQNEIAASMVTPVPNLLPSITDPPIEQERQQRPWFFLGPPNVR